MSKMNILQIFSLIFLFFFTNSSRVSVNQTPTTCCDKDNTISVSGTGSLSIPTNIIRLGFTIETKEKEARLSFTKNKEITTKVNQILLNETNIPMKNITTTNFQIFPKYKYIKDENKNNIEIFDGYVVSNQLDIKLSDKDIATQLIDSLVNAGVNRINYINFTTQQELVNAAKKKVIALAVIDAFSRANVVAANSKVKIIDVISINISDSYKPLAQQAMSSAPVAAMVSNGIFTGQREISQIANIQLKVKKI
jgi:uncharacterized protein